MADIDYAKLGAIHIESNIKLAIKYLELAPDVVENKILLGISYFIYSLILRKSRTKKYKLSGKNYENKGISLFSDMLNDCSRKEYGSFYLGLWFKEEKGFQYLSDAAELGNMNAVRDTLTIPGVIGISPSAQYNLGLIYMYPNVYNITKVPDYKTGFKWMSRSALQNNSHAMYVCSIMYKLGLGVDQDENKSQYWFNKSGYDILDVHTCPNLLIPKNILSICTKYNIESYGE